MQWLNENDEVSLEYLHGAFNRDKKDGVISGNDFSILGRSLANGVFFREWKLLKHKCTNDGINSFVLILSLIIVWPKPLNAPGILLNPT